MGRQVIVIGGGASGLTAAIWAARAGAGVTLLEHMDRVGKKILSTGNGKCNLTNLVQDPSCYRGGTAGICLRGNPAFFCGGHARILSGAGRSAQN